MSDANGWPDAGHPGVPENPERDGWHWLADDIGKRIAARWKANPYPTWSLRAFLSPSDVIGLGWSYLGPALLPAEVAAREAAAAEAMREAAAQYLFTLSASSPRWGSPEEHGKHIRSLPLPAASAGAAT